MLDFDSDKTSPPDLQDSFSNASPPLPLVPGSGFIARAEADFHSLYLRNPQPDCPPATPLGLPREPTGPPPPLPTPAAVVAAHLPPLQPRTAYEPLYIPPEVITQSMTSAQISWSVTLPGGEKKEVYILNAPVTHTGALLKQPYSIENLPPPVGPGGGDPGSAEPQPLPSDMASTGPPPRRASARLDADRTRRLARTRELHALYSKEGADQRKLLEERSGGVKPQFAYRMLEDWERDGEDVLEGTMTVGDTVVASLKGVACRLCSFGDAMESAAGRCVSCSVSVQSCTSLYSLHTVALSV